MRQQSLISATAAGLVLLATAPAAQATRMTDPDSFLCDDGARFTVTYIAQPVIALLAYGGVIYVLKPERTASGARFVMADELGQEVSFWNKGEEARLEMPGQPLRTCRRV